MRKPSPALAVSLVALFFSLTGAGIAASHFLITSVSQIKPSVRAALRGDKGPTGAPGLPGPAGAPGPQGAPGAPGAPGSLVNGAYMASTDRVLSPADRPDVEIDVFCKPGDHVVTGGFSGYAEIVTQSQVVDSSYSPDGAFHRWGEWVVLAHFDPAYTSGQGSVRAWALCTPPA